MQIEYEAIVKNGFLLQIDAPDLALERHLTYNDRPLSRVSRFRRERRRGDQRGDRQRAARPGSPACLLGQLGVAARLRRAARRHLPILRQANVGGFVLPFANPRHAHEFRFSRNSAGRRSDHGRRRDRRLTDFVEHPEVVADRLEAWPRAVGDPTRVLAGTDCGFDTSAGWGRVTEDVVWAKRSCVTARESRRSGCSKRG